MEAKKLENFTWKLSTADDKDKRWTDAEKNCSFVKSNTAFKIFSKSRVSSLSIIQSKYSFRQSSTWSRWAAKKKWQFPLRPTG